MSTESREDEERTGDEGEPETPESGATETPENGETETPENGETETPEGGKAEAPARRRPRRSSREVPASSPSGSAPRRRPSSRTGGERAVEVRAQAKYVRTAPRKARLVIDHIRGKDVEQARAILTLTTRAAALDVLKLLDSAVANAENNHELVADELKVGRAYVDEGPTLKRYRPRALGRATQIRKRTSHMTIALTPKE